MFIPLLSLAMTIGNMTPTPANNKLQERAILSLKASAPPSLRIYGTGPFQVLKVFRKQRLLLLRGQAEFQATFADVLKHFDLSPGLKILENSS